MALVKLLEKFEVEKIEINRLKREILCLLPTVWLRLKTSQVPVRARYRARSTNLV